MKVYVDDVLEAPEGWTRASTYQEAIDLLGNNQVEALDLDHDLGEEKTGCDILEWIRARQDEINSYIPPEILIHSNNYEMRLSMRSQVKDIERKCKRAQIVEGA